MRNETASSPTDSGCAGVSRPVSRKGIVVLSSFILDLVEGTEVEILWEDADCYKVWPVSKPYIAQLVPKELIQEVSVDA